MKSEDNMNLFVKYLTNSLSENEKNAFEKWLSESPENKEQLLTIKKYWETSGKTFDSYEPDYDNAWDKIHRNTLGREIVNKNEKRFIPRKFSRIAAAILILITVGISGIYLHSIIQENKGKLLIYTSGKEVRELKLNDGSTVWLNINSELQVLPNYLKRNRKVKLSGEAFFDVAKNQKKPFIIKTDRTITKVLGTSFNIKETSNDIVVTLESGEVEFFELYRKRNGVYITKNGKANYSKTTKTINTSNNTNLNYLAWKTGKIEFKNTALKMVCEQLSEIYGKKIICSVTLVNKHSITGTFTNAPLEEILEVIELTTNLKFEISEDAITIK
jgi:ferric-dicitrate binding protein FerR (iron transport regulator)